jgi:hypothetical protein
MSDVASGFVRAFALSVSAALALGCVRHAPGLEVELVLDVALPRAIADTQLTLVELLPCPGSRREPGHTHEESAPWSMPLGGRERAVLTPRVGRYCDLRLQLRCRDASSVLLLDASSLGAARRLRLTAGGLGDDGTLAEPQHALERLVRVMLVSTCE